MHQRRERIKIGNDGQPPPEANCPLSQERPPAHSQRMIFAFRQFRPRPLRASAVMATGLLLAFALSACTDDRRQERLALAGPTPNLASLMAVADAEIGARKFGQCAACHRIKKNGADLGGPNLYGFQNAPFASLSHRFGYTAALRDAGGRWDDENLDRWIRNTKKMVPGTSMNFAGVADPLDRADIITYMKSMSGSDAAAR